MRAVTVVAKLDAELQRYWKDRRRGRDRDGGARYEQACNRARSLVLNYLPAADAAHNLTLDDILRRFEILTRGGTADSSSEVSAVLGHLTSRQDATAATDHREQTMHRCACCTAQVRRSALRYEPAALKPRLAVESGLVHSTLPLASTHRASASRDKDGRLIRNEGVSRGMVRWE